MCLRTADRAAMPGRLEALGYDLAEPWEPPLLNSPTEALLVCKYTLAMGDLSSLTWVIGLGDLARLTTRAATCSAADRRLTSLPLALNRGIMGAQPGQQTRIAVRAGLRKHHGTITARPPACTGAAGLVWAGGRKATEDIGR
jgi:hypothetical protein